MLYSIFWNSSSLYSVTMESTPRVRKLAFDLPPTGGIWQIARSLDNWTDYLLAIQCDGGAAGCVLSLLAARGLTDGVSSR
jgi:hypothetical protein